MEASPARVNERRRVKRGPRHRAPQMDIPAFGDWEFLHNDHIPITQYFDFHHHQSPTPPRTSLYPPYHAYYSTADDMFLHYDDFQQQHYRPFPPFHTPIDDPIMNWEKEVGPQIKEECGTRRRRRRRQQRRSCLENKNRVFDFDTTATLTETPNSAKECSNDAVRRHGDIEMSKSKNNIKAKDEDLYKIPPELLHPVKPKKKMSKFFTKCFITICASH